MAGDSKIQMRSTFDFAHFVTAQNRVYPAALSELRSGRKRTHWMWFVFPQLKGLGQSPHSQKFGLTGIDHAAAYCEHDILGPRLRACVEIVNTVEGRTALQIFGQTDTLKFRSCLTLFFHATDDPIYQSGLDKYFEGKDDPLTLRRL